jgi:hypothetical protein
MANSVDGGVHGCHDCNELDKTITEVAELIFERDALGAAAREAEAVRNDVRLYGQAFIRDGKRLEPAQVQICDEMNDKTDVRQRARELPENMPVEFGEWFGKNYPGPETIISDPHWHAPRIWRAARHAMLAAAQSPDPMHVPVSRDEE